MYLTNVEGIRPGKAIFNGAFGMEAIKNGGRVILIQSD